MSVLFRVIRFCSSYLLKISFVFLNSTTVVHKTEVVKNSLNPVWRELSIPVSELCNGNWDRPVRVECYDWDSDGR
mgnify:CR=1 FL=1